MKGGKKRAFVSTLVATTANNRDTHDSTSALESLARSDGDRTGVTLRRRARAEHQPTADTVGPRVHGFDDDGTTRCGLSFPGNERDGTTRRPGATACREGQRATLTRSSRLRRTTPDDTESPTGLVPEANVSTPLTHHSNLNDLIEIEPLVRNRPYPDSITTFPPVPVVDVVSPAVMTISPPLFVLPLPTVRLMEPP